MINERLAKKMAASAAGTPSKTEANAVPGTVAGKQIAQLNDFYLHRPLRLGSKPVPVRWVTRIFMPSYIALAFCNRLYASKGAAKRAAGFMDFSAVTCICTLLSFLRSALIIIFFFYFLTLYPHFLLNERKVAFFRHFRVRVLFFI